MNARTVEILDTTLRDGVQSAGVVFSLEDKIKLVRALDSLGVRYIEAGNPFSNPKDAELFRFARDKLKLKNARLAAFGMTRRPGAAAEDDPGLRAILDSGAHIASIVGKSCAFQVREVLGKTLEENLRMIEDTVRFLTESGMAVFFDAEHFFDGYSDDPDYALETLRAAERGGAERLVLCDTNGGTLPGAVAGAVSARLRSSGRRSRSTATTTPDSRPPRRFSRSRRGLCRCRARSTATASGAATRTSAR